MTQKHQANAPQAPEKRRKPAGNTSGAGAAFRPLAGLSCLPPDLRELLKRELPKLEADIWAESERETADGMACNRGAPEGQAGRKGRMVDVPVSAQDEQRRKEILTSTVLPRWLQRCGARCAQVWNSTIGPARGIPVPKSP